MEKARIWCAVNLLVIVAFLALPSCSKTEEWTAEERQNARYILLAFEEKQQATRIGNSGAAFSQMSASDFDMMRSHLKKAYEYALLGRVDKF